MIMAPPPLPRTAFSGDRWTFQNIDMVKATRLAKQFAATYAHPVDFPVAFPIPCLEPQGCLTFSYDDEVRILLHFVETHAEHASITSIAMSQTESEAQKALLSKVIASPKMSLHPSLAKQQPRWGMLARYYVGW